MKKSKKQTILIIVLAIIVITLGIILFIKKGIPLNSNSSVVTESYSYLGNNDLQKCGGLVTYSKDEVTNKNLSEETKICLAYNKVNKDDIEEVKIDKTKKENICKLDDKLIFATDNYEDKICTLTKLNKDEVNNEYKNMFGSDISEYKQFQYGGATICYVKDDAYYCGLSETFTYSIGAEPHTYRAIKDAYKKGDELIIYDYFLKVINDECFTSYMDATKNDKCSTNYSELTNKDMTYKFLKKNGTLYKHTFKKDGKSYYWVSSKPVN